jgi:crossover junction endodeoxyribonuclease RuvC
MRVLGIDPGTAATGYGVVDAEGSRMRAVERGVITTPARQPLEQRLAEIHARVAELIGRLAPDSVALEDLYIGGNPRTVLSVGHARGAVLAACGSAGLSAAGYPPAEVKSSVCGFGRADKLQVQRMVGAMLAIDLSGDPDHATDALGVAICHAVRSAGARRLQAAAR